MRAAIAVLAAIAAPAIAQGNGPVTQISDGQIQNPATTPSAIVATSFPVVTSPVVTSPVVSEASSLIPTVSIIVPGPSNLTVVATGASTGSASTGIFVNSTAASTLASSASVAASSGASSGASSSASASGAVSTGGASAQQVGFFGVAAGLAALFLA